MPDKNDTPPSPFKTKQCPKCQTWNANRAKKCSNCGTNLPAKKGKAARRRIARRAGREAVLVHTGYQAARSAAPAVSSTYHDALEFIVKSGSVKAAKAAFDKAAGLAGEVG